MKLLLDECLHPQVGRLLVEIGHDVATIAGLGMVGAGDPDVLAVAGQQDRVLVTLDTDFGALLARTSATLPSVLLIRRRDHRPHAIVAVVVDVLSTCGDALSSGALAVVGERTVRVRELPLST
ncbi:MAG TPA: DUF5615 family PIN-like protein [Sporichthyaceae bacterium]|nr:DUF5615 family PIN-like protein [Sporichthyaceae bacterium]